MASIPIRGIEDVMWGPDRVSLGGRLNDLFAVVEAAVRADPMRLLWAAAVATRLQAGCLELPMRAPLAPAGAGVPALGDCHRSIPPVRGRCSAASIRAAASTGPEVQIGAAPGAQPHAGLAAAWRDRKFEQQR